MSEGIKSVALRIFQLSPTTKSTLWEWKFDAVLLLASAICFGTFLERSINLEQVSGIGGPIALMTHGNAERKAAGTNLFVDIETNSNLFNLDAIWVGKDNEATIQLEGDITIKLAEKTLMILKRPFKHRSDQSSFEQAVKVVKGKVQATDGKSIIPEAALLPPILPEDSPKETQGEPIQLYPKENSVLYMRPEKNIPLIFAWPTSLSGYIVIQDKITGRRIYSEIQNQRHFSAKLEQPGSYFWQIIDSDRRPMLGPYTFVVKHLDEKSAKELLKSGANENTEVYW
jgi:hypothetical protein